MPKHAAILLLLINGCDEASRNNEGGAGGIGSSTSNTNATSAASTSNSASTSTGASGVGGGATCETPPIPGRPSAADCVSYCNALDAANCPNDLPVEACIAECTEETAFYSESCEEVTIAFLACVATDQIDCNANGNAVFGGCSAEAHAFERCSSCIVISSDDECLCCEATSCCVPLTDLLDAEDQELYLACRQACGPNPGCWENCGNQYPAAGVAFDGYNFCINGACGTACFQ
jgi:hypothetical protein